MSKTSKLLFWFVTYLKFQQFSIIGFDTCSLFDKNKLKTIL